MPSNVARKKIVLKWHMRNVTFNDHLISWCTWKLVFRHSVAIVCPIHNLHSVCPVSLIVEIHATITTLGDRTTSLKIMLYKNTARQNRKCKFFNDSEYIAIHTQSVTTFCIVVSVSINIGGELQNNQQIGEISGRRCCDDDRPSVYIAVACTRRLTVIAVVHRRSSCGGVTRDYWSKCSSKAPHDNY